MKNKTTALLLSIFVGGLGIDRFYLGYTGMGVLKLLTGGCFGVLYIIDIINIATGKLLPADGNPYESSAQTATVPKQPDPSALDELEKLSKLHKDGIITDEEFATLKKNYLDKI